MTYEFIECKYENGRLEWYKNKFFHREGGPAIEKANGDKIWYINGLLHRENGPAVEYANGYKEWWVNGKRHREDGPAVEYTSGTKEWYLNGQLHREDGPAVESFNGNKQWFIRGKQLSQKEFNVQILNLKNAVKQIKKQFNNQSQANNKEKENTMATSKQPVTSVFRAMKPRDHIVVKDLNGKEYQAFNFGKSRFDGAALIYVENPDATMGGFSMNAANLESLKINHGYKYIESNADKHNIDFSKGRFIWATESGIGSTIRVVRKSEDKMGSNKETTTSKNGFMQMLKADAEKAAYRVAGTQITEAFKGIILMGLQTQAGVAPAKIDAIREVLEGPMGNILVSTMLGHGLEYLPQVGEDPRVQKIAEEFRIQGMATAGNELMNVAGKFVLPALTSALDNLPGGKAQVRVEANAPPALQNNDEEIEVEVVEETETLASAKA